MGASLALGTASSCRWQKEYITPMVDRPEGWGKEQIEAWEAVHYHQPSDELVNDWNFEGMVDDALLGFDMGLYLAEQEERPTWNPGDEFEAARLEALANLGAGN